MTPIGRYMRGKLHRRLFFLLGGSIAFTVLVVGVVFHFTSSEGGAWGREVERVRAFTGGLFERAWDSPAERGELATSLARDLDVDVALTDSSRAPMGSFGEAACTQPAMTIPVVRDGRVLGYALVCTGRHRPTSPWRMALPLIVAVMTLWGASGAITRRLTRPYGELARVAKEIGAGKLSSRYSLARCGDHGEARMLAESINDMATRIEKQVADQRELLAAVSHEIRTPLSRIRLLVELARTGPRLDGKTLDELDREVIEIDALVGELLASSRLDFTALSPHELDATDVAKRALERAGADAGSLVVLAPGAKFAGDPTLIARALANLLDNANGHGGGVVALRVRQTPGHVVFEVDDAGAGIAPGDEKRVFESFYQRPGEGVRDKGSLGLGLTLVERIALAHGGKAFAANRAEGGARVGIELPTARASAA